MYLNVWLCVLSHTNVYIFMWESKHMCKNIQFTSVFSIDHRRTVPITGTKQPTHQIARIHWIGYMGSNGVSCSFGLCHSTPPPSVECIKKIWQYLMFTQHDTCNVCVIKENICIIATPPTPLSFITHTTTTTIGTLTIKGYFHILSSFKCGMLCM